MHNTITSFTKEWTSSESKNTKISPYSNNKIIQLQITLIMIRKKHKNTYRPKTQRVTWRPLSRHFSGFGSLFLHFKNSTFSRWHLVPMCLCDAISTADVGIWSSAASTPLPISNRISAPNNNNNKNPKFSEPSYLVTEKTKDPE